MEFIENLKWRYATKKFDSSRKVIDSELAILKEAVRLSVSSYGLQLFKVLIIEDQHIKRQLKAAAFDQNQLIDASHIFVFCNYTSVTDENIDDYIENKAETEEINLSELKGYGDFMKNTIGAMPLSDRNNWTHRQTYLAMGNLLHGCASLKIDACPMEGFDNQRFNQILDLEKRGLNAAVITAVGYRSALDETQFKPKVRKPEELLFESV